MIKYGIGINILLDKNNLYKSTSVWPVIRSKNILTEAGFEASIYC